MKITEIPHPGGRYIRSEWEKQMRDEIAKQWRECGHVEARQVWRREKIAARIMMHGIFYTEKPYVSPLLKVQWEEI